jgi:hypothetical protein
MSRKGSNSLVVPQAKAEIEQMKYEVAQQLGIQWSPDGYNGNMTTREAGTIGGNITRTLIQIAEQQLGGANRF